MDRRHQLSDLLARVLRTPACLEERSECHFAVFPSPPLRIYATRRVSSTVGFEKVTSLRWRWLASSTRVSSERAEQPRLSDPQLTVARSYGYPSWPMLMIYVEAISALTRKPGRVQAQRRPLRSLCAWHVISCGPCSARIGGTGVWSRGGAMAGGA